MSAQVLTTIRELDHRTSDGIDVRLLWCERENRVTVSVRDGRKGESFSIEVRDGQSALDVFHHPFAYAAARGSDVACDMPPAEEWSVRAA